MNKRILRLSEVTQITGLSRSTIYQQLKKGQFPAQVRLGPRMVGWVEGDIQNWISEKIQTSHLLKEVKNNA